MKIELYTEYPIAALPLGVVLKGEDKYAGFSRTVENLVLMRWPDGRPCHLINQWLMEKALSTLAQDTVRVYAAQLTHTIRYCYESKINFFDFTDDHFDKFSNKLQTVKKSNSPHSAEFIGGNHVRAIQQRTLHFLLWIATKYPGLSTTPLIGTNEACQVVIEYRINSRNGRREIYHRYLKPLESDKDDKNVITEVMIAKLFNAIFTAHDVDNLPVKSRTKLVSDPELFIGTNSYLYERRLFTIRMMKLTGLRPEELLEIPLNLNDNVQTTRYIAIPTKKQGFPPPIRKFSINTKAALDFQRYLDNREKFLKLLTQRKIISITPSSILVGERGTPIMKESITKEFSRLCKSAAFGDVRCCLSMFRHRFITREINGLLLERFEQHAGLKIQWTDALREDICSIVKSKTGHRQTSSLYHYFHEEYRLLSNDEGRDTHLSTLNELSDNQDRVYELKHLARLRHNSKAAALADKIQNDIDTLYKELYGGKVVEVLDDDDLD
ncbi:hypothetical protein [Pseudomonas sp. BF-B-25]|uniref:hypothetical protein n=1 Tax=Pseudomonas sp. BF-B-25 TaxID=2832355 RepID=UPI001CBEBBB8|nr:hypothetical protein [Pseudomonas sp. BF-B-25]